MSDSEDEYGGASSSSHSLQKKKKKGNSMLKAAKHDMRKRIELYEAREQEVASLEFKKEELKKQEAEFVRRTDALFQRFQGRFWSNLPSYLLISCLP